MVSVWTWIDIALGALIAAAYLIKLTVGRAQPEADPWERTGAWLLLGTGLLLLASGVAVLAARNNVIEWAVRLVIAVIVALMIISEFRSWRARHASQPD